MAWGLPEGNAPQESLKLRVRRKAERWMESKGWLPPYRRLVVVCGMARTGTTALAAYLGSHPDLRLVVGGPLWHRLESEYVRTAVNWGFIDGLLQEVWPAMVVLKQPWLERNVDFFDRAKGAKVIVCTREPETLFQSWCGSGREYVGEECRYKPSETYMVDMFRCVRLLMHGAMEVQKECMNSELAGPLAKFLGIDAEGFSATRISAPWAGKKEQAWVEAHAIWRDRR